MRPIDHIDPSRRRSFVICAALPSFLRGRGRVNRLARGLLDLPLDLPLDDERLYEEVFSFAVNRGLTEPELDRLAEVLAIEPELPPLDVEAIA